MKTNSNTQKPNLVWDFFSSVKLTVVLLIVLATASIVGTLIPQGQEAAQFARELSPQTFRLFSALDLFDMYHSAWFRLLIGCLVLNLVVCSINRFPGAWKRFKRVPKPDRARVFEDLPPEQVFTVSHAARQTAGGLDSFLQKRFKKTHRKESGGSYFFLAEKGRYAHFGVYLVHLSVLLILVGGLVSSFAGFEAYVEIPEGERIDTVILRNNNAARELGFEVGLDKFFVDFYENGSPREFRSDLRFFADGREVEKTSVRVNHPAEFRGITFYQSSYGTVPGRRVLLHLVRNRSEAESRMFELEPGNPRLLPGGEGSFKVVTTRSMGSVPAALVAVQPHQGDEIRFWVFQDFEAMRARLPEEMLASPKLDPAAFKPYLFELEAIANSYYTGLQVNKDPGVPAVWAGCFLMVGGFLVTFFTSHRRFWIRLSPARAGTTVSVAATAGKNPVGLQRELEKLLQNLRSLWEGNH